MSEEATAPSPSVVMPLRAWLALSHVLVFAFPVVVLVISGALGQDLRNQTREDLEHQAALIALLLETQIREARKVDPTLGPECCAEAISSQLRFAKAKTLSGIQVTDRRGVVVSTSGRSVGEDISGAPEVAAALAGREHVKVRPRPAPSTRQPLSSKSRRARVRLFIAVPVALDGEVLGSIVVSRTPREEIQALYQMAPAASMFALGALMLTFTVAWCAGILASRSLRRLDSGSQRVAEGDFGGIEELAHPQQSHIAEVARLATSHTRMARRLQERLAYIGEFASNVSHEFKTPLSTLQGTIELLGDDDSMPHEQRERFLSNAAGELQRLERLVTGLLTLARADLSEAHEVVELQRLMSEVAEHHGVDVTGQAGRVLGDAAQLRSVASNLVGNALTHGGDGVTVTVAAFAEEGSTGFVVEDDGPGISEANLPHVFDRFFTTARQDGGTGLGLALVRAIVERHGGEVSVRSGGGRTAFRVQLPAFDTT
ncbi:MAG: hypothetical protein KTR31_01305 [Myxococcales bacterium]|nr:hypothetical protein [Myxococcales bacterium]